MQGKDAGVAIPTIELQGFAMQCSHRERLANSRSPCKLAHLTHFLVALRVTIEFFTTLKLVPVRCVSECPSRRIVVSRVQLMISEKKIVPASPEELKLQSRVMESLAHPLYR